MSHDPGAWQTHEDDDMGYDNNTLSVLKALGRQGISIRSYNGSRGVTALRAWMDSVQRHLRLFNIKGGENQVLLAVCFLEGRARTWWDKTYATGAAKEIQDLEQLYKALQQEFQPLNEDFKMAMQWKALQQKGDLNFYRQEVYQLRGHLPFGEVAEFYHTLIGLKQELRAPVIAELRWTNVRYLPLS